MKPKEKAKKVPLKQRNPYKYYRNAYYACEAGEWSCIIAPIVAVFGAKWNEYFIFTDGNTSGVKLTIGCILAFILAAVFIYKKMKHQEKMENKVTMLSYAVGIGVAFAFSYLFKVVIDDLFLILGCEFAGAVAAYGTDFATQSNYGKMKLYKDAIDKLDAEDAAKRIQEEKKGGRRGTWF
ncbi:MAG: hypothetical protein LKG11_00695 [Bacilli bacterium]|jgi:peptidoglycan biosynthesis protein MviN/MurJ (putative lipid II flippase)|nr:hypothetical protein [Bacilli bacterium]